jgi:hypothetical protein
MNGLRHVISNEATARHEQISDNKTRGTIVEAHLNNSKPNTAQAEEKVQ